MTALASLAHEVQVGMIALVALVQVGLALAIRAQAGQVPTLAQAQAGTNMVVIEFLLALGLVGVLVLGIYIGEKVSDIVKRNQK
jgi:hypothetical protein